MRGFLIFLSVWVFGQPETVPLDLDGWTVQAQECHLVKYLGQEAIRLQGGYALAPTAAFRDGTIEFDIAFAPARSFSGIGFRVVDAFNYEHFYLRPHQTGQVDANQYTPSFHGVAGWQLYHGPEYGGAIDYDFDAWMHVKIVTEGRRAAFYINDMEHPLFVNEALKREVVAGGIAFTASALAPAYFANLTLTRTTAVPAAPNAATVPEGFVGHWSVSSVMPQSSLGAFEWKDVPNLTWQTLRSEPSGIVNLAQIGRPTREADTILAKVVLQADGKTHKMMQFGYSDHVRVYLNGQQLYEGDNGYQSRDYRYLGTVGLFDALPLNLKKGENELIFAVTERFGGWGVMCRFEDLAGLTFK
ncbi:MAG: hypothetical protein KDC35_14110 [Acidobacteria bacterium]|nr:hypothetical protein [Acidobacteriota bacterium]